MVITKLPETERMIHSQDHSGGFDEIDGASGSKPKRVVEGWHSSINSPHLSSQQWASLQSTHDMSPQYALHQYPCGFSDGSLHSLMSREEVPALPFPGSSKLADGCHGPIGGPIVSAIIGPEGGRLEIHGNVLTIPRGAVVERTKIELGLVWNEHLRPSFGTDCQMTSILSCQPSGLRFCKPAILSLPHCLEANPSTGKQIRPVLYSSHHVNDGRPEWTRCRLLGDSFTLRQQSIEVRVHDFCYLVWTFEDDRPDVPAKRIRIVPYASPISTGQDQKIRLHIFDDVEAVREKVKKEEEELGGKRLTSYHSYVLLKNEGNLIMEMTWNTVGWVLCTPPSITMPFREMWAFDHNSCEMHFINEGKKPDFNCNIDVQQQNNESKVLLSFGHEVQVTEMDSPDGPRSRAAPGKIEEKLSVPQEETRSMRFSSLQFQLPEVPPAPDVAIKLLSISKTSNSRGKGSREQHFSFAKVETTQRHQPPPSAMTIDEVDQCMGVPSIIQGVKEMEVSCHILPKDEGPSRRRDGAQYGRLALHEEATTAITTHNRNQSNAAVATDGRRAAIQQYFIENMHVNCPGYAGQNRRQMSLQSPSIIPFQLKKNLSLKLDYGVNNWMQLSRYWKLDREYDETASIEKSPAWVILSAAEERKIVKSLDDLRDALRKIKRDDCVDIVDKYEGISADEASDSDL